MKRFLFAVACVSALTLFSEDETVFYSCLGFNPDPYRIGEDGKPVLSDNSTARHAYRHKLMWDAGIRVHSTLIFSGWTGPDQYDYTETDRTLKLLFDAVPDMKYIPRIKLNAPVPWLKAYPEEAFVYPKGPRDPAEVRELVGTAAQDYYGAGESSCLIANQSFASERWATAAEEALRRLIDHLKSSPYADRIVALHLAWGTCGETCHWGRQWGNYGDFSSAFERAFRKWGGKGPVDPERDEYKRFMDHLNASLIHRFGSVVKNGFGRQFPVGVFYGYMLECSNAAYSGWLGFDEVLADEAVDFLAGPCSYERRGAGDPGGWLGPAQSVNLRKKWFDEIDIRTHLAAKGAYFPPCRTPKETKAVLAREMCKNLAADANYWWMDLSGGWYDSAEMVEIVRELEALSRKIRSRRHESAADVLLLVDEDALRTRKLDDPAFGRVLDSIREMHLSGMLIDIYRVKDLPRLDQRRYRRIVSFDRPDARYPKSVRAYDRNGKLPDCRGWRADFEAAGCKAYADVPAAVYGDNRFVAVFPKDRPDEFSLRETGKLFYPAREAVPRP